METRYYLAGTLTEGGEERAFLHCSDGDGVCQYGKRWYGDGAARASDFVFAEGHTLISGWAEDSAGAYGTLLKYDTATGELLAQLGWQRATDTVQFQTLALTQYGLVAVGAASGADGDWQTLSGNSSGFGVSWQDAPYGPAYDYWDAPSDLEGNVTDITAEFKASTDEASTIDRVLAAQRRIP